MLDATEFLKAMKRSAIEAVDAAKPVSVMFGTVLSTSPLKISVEQKLILGAVQLILTEKVTDHKVDVLTDIVTDPAEVSIKSPDSVIQGYTEAGGDPEHTHYFTAQSQTVNGAVSAEHTHVISGKKTVTICYGLSVGDEVLLLRQQGGQKFIVLDRIGK